MVAGADAERSTAKHTELPLFPFPISKHHAATCISITHKEVECGARLTSAHAEMCFHMPESMLPPPSSSASNKGDA